MLTCIYERRLMTLNGFFRDVISNLGCKQDTDGCVHISKDKAVYASRAIYSALRSGKLAQYIDKNLLPIVDSVGAKIDTMRYITAMQIHEIADQVDIMQTLTLWVQNSPEKELVFS